MRKLPVPSVITDRTFSISAGLAASTVTPGSTAPDVSLTTPPMEACAYAAPGTSTRQAIANRIPFKARIRFLSFAPPRQPGRVRALGHGASEASPPVRGGFSLVVEAGRF